MTILDAARGRWPDLLQQLAGLTPEQLTDKHQPCPLCGGKDRYRFDDQDGSGSWFCNKCGGKACTGGGGNGMDMLMRRMGWSFAEASQRIEQHLGLAKPIPAPPLKGWDAHWRYTDTFYVLRRNLPDGEKDIRPLWWDGEAWRRKAPPAPRPLYWARRDASLQLLIVEGEKTADAAAALFPNHAVLTWASGCNAIDKADWSPVSGRRCVLWPDADMPGREAMAKLAPRLLSAGAAQVRIVHPPKDVPEGWDLADADWSSAQAAAHLMCNRSAPVELLEPLTEPEPVAELTIEVLVLIVPE